MYSARAKGTLAQVLVQRLEPSVSAAVRALASLSCNRIATGKLDLAGAWHLCR